jgi:glycosyltransferase involved in cell wall biosynthesis
MDTNPDVSVIMPVHNGQKYLKESISSVLDQDYENFELICIDDGSTDQSRDIIKSFNDKRIAYHYQRHCGSPSAARNAGIKRSMGTHLAFIDQDDLYEPYSLSERFEVFKENPKVVFVYSDCHVVDSEGRFSELSFTEMLNTSPRYGYCFKDLFIKNFIPIQGVMIKSELFRSVGCFCEELLGTDDYHMWLRISHDNYINYLDKCLASWRNHPYSLSKRIIKMDENIAACLESITKIFPDCEKLIGEDHLRKRMYQVCYDAAYGNLQSENWSVSRKWLKKCLKWQSSFHVFMKYFEASSLEYLQSMGLVWITEQYGKWRWSEGDA